MLYIYFQPNISMKNCLKVDPSSNKFGTVNFPMYIGYNDILFNLLSCSLHLKVK